MFDYMPGFKRLLDTSASDTMDELCRRFAGFFRYAKTLEMLATGIQSGAIKVPKQVRAEPTSSVAPIRCRSPTPNDRVDASRVPFSLPQRMQPNVTITQSGENPPVLVG